MKRIPGIGLVCLLAAIGTAWAVPGLPGLTTVTFEPLSGSFTAPATVPVVVRVVPMIDTVTVSSVAVYNGNPNSTGILLGQATVRPGDSTLYDFSWPNVATGGYTLYAAAVDSTGGTSTTATPLAVTVAAAGPPPDLYFTALTVSTTKPYVGAAFTVKATLKNQGTGASTGGTLTVAPFAGASGTDLVTQALPAIAKGSTATVTVTVPGQTVVGAKVLTATLSGVTGETVLANNSKTAGYTLTALPPPDLYVTKLTVTPTKPYDAAPLTVTATVKNKGRGAAAAGGLLTLVPAVGAPPLSQTLPALAATKGVTTVVFTDVPGQLAGRQTATATISDVANETVVTNNKKTASYTVQARPEFSILSITFSPAAPVCGGTYTAYVTIKNNGGRAAAGYLDVWTNYVDGRTATKSVKVSTISAGMTKKVTITRLAAGSTAGELLFRAEIDARKTVPEVDETNNAATVPYTPCPG